MWIAQLGKRWIDDREVADSDPGGDVFFSPGSALYPHIHTNVGVEIAVGKKVSVA